MKTPKVDFLGRELDSFVGKWLGQGLSEAELAEWRKILTYETRFREQFCDWVKSLREPAWIRDRQGHAKRSRS